MPQDDAFPTGEWEQDIQLISDWLITHTLCRIDIVQLFGEFCRKLSLVGIPLLRGTAAMRAIHPMYEAKTYTWWRGEGVRSTELPYAEQQPNWHLTPVRPMIEHQLTEIEYAIRQETADDFPLFKELLAAGATQYVASLIPFDQVQDAYLNNDGLILSWVTDRPGGFSKTERLVLKRLETRFAVAAKMTKREQTAYNIVTAYMGRDTGQRVLSGQIRLGDGEVIPSVIWYSDMRQSTQLCESLSHTQFLEALNDYFAATAGAVMASGGEVLRFIGDAVLAIYPIGDGGFTAEHACRRALTAAHDAWNRLDATNAGRLGRNLPTLDFGLALHKGEVLYGNIGIPARVEFSVTGPAANETARLEGLTKELGERVVVSKTFADQLAISWQPKGRFDLVGVSRPQEVFAPPMEVIDNVPAWTA